MVSSFVELKMLFLTPTTLKNESLLRNGRRDVIIGSVDRPMPRWSDMRSENDPYPEQPGPFVPHRPAWASAEVVPEKSLAVSVHPLPHLPEGVGTSERGEIVAGHLKIEKRLVLFHF